MGGARNEGLRGAGRKESGLGWGGMSKEKLNGDWS